MTCLPAVSWGPAFGWALAALPIKITVIIKANVTGMRSASQVTQQKPSNCQRLQGKHRCVMQWCWAGCCSAVPLHLPVLSCSLPAPSLPGCWAQSSPLRSLSICGYMRCPFPNHTFVLRPLFPFFRFLLSFFPLWCAPVSPCSRGLSSSFPVHPRGPFPTLPVVAVSNSIVLLGTEANGVINYLLSAGPSSEGDR